MNKPKIVPQPEGSDAYWWERSGFPTINQPCPSCGRENSAMMDAAHLRRWATEGGADMLLDCRVCDEKRQRIEKIQREEDLLEEEIAEAYARLRG